MKPQQEIKEVVAEPPGIPSTAVSVDKLTLLWRYPPSLIEDILTLAEGAISCDGSWYSQPWQQMDAQPG